jgi:hypothetical protein
LTQPNKEKINQTKKNNNCFTFAFCITINVLFIYITSSNFFFLTVFYSSSDASLAEIFVYSQISWPRSGDCGGAGFEPGTAASSVWCRPVALANPLEPSKFFFEFFLQIWGKGVLLAQTGKSKWIFTYNKVSQRNLTKTPRTLNYARAVSLVLYEDVNDLSCTVKICLKTDKFKPV